jgi:hypothetical protein
MRLVEAVQARNVTEPKYRYNENEIYHELVSQLFKTAFHKADHFELVFAGRGKRNRTAALRAASRRSRDAEMRSVSCEKAKRAWSRRDSMR